MVNYKKMDPKTLVEEISQKVKNKEAKTEDVVNLLKEAREEMPEEFMEEVESTLHVLAEEMQELREALSSKDEDSTGTGGSSGGSVFSRLNAFAKFVQILKDGGPYSIIAVLICSNMWFMWELREANNRIIDLLVTLQLSGTVSAPAILEPTPTPVPTIAVKPPPASEAPPQPTYSPKVNTFRLPPDLPEPVRRRVLNTRDMYEQQMQQQYQVQAQAQEEM